MKTIVLDPGHGGYDYGAVNGNRYEKNDNLRLALAVRDKLLTQQGIKVIMTRESDVFIPLLERSYISNAASADIFVSLHRNSSTNPASNGVENYVYINPSAKSIAYATNVLNNVVNVGVQNNRGLKSDDFSVLRNTYAPAQLLELGFISNFTDNLYFDRYFDSYATAIARGIMTSLGLSYVIVNERAATIKSIQSTLNSRYNTGLTVDGIYGPSTRRGIIKGIQSELNSLYGAGLSVDGVFGPMTKANIRSLRRGASGYYVYLLQAALFANGYNLTLDGIFGRQTEEALLEFQQSRGLTPDAIAGPGTFSALLT